MTQQVQEKSQLVDEGLNPDVEELPLNQEANLNTEANNKSESQGTLGDAVVEDEATIWARVYGESMVDLPKDLYIPPDALEVILEAFEGPLDLLLYLIRKQNLDILDIPIAEITKQYMQYVEMMKSLNLELAAEYLVMAALLGEIKSRCLLPKNEEALEDEEDPRAELVRRLQLYEQFKQASDNLDELPQVGRDVFEVSAKAPNYRKSVEPPMVEFKDLIFAFREVLLRADLFESHQIVKEQLSTREKMTHVLAKLKEANFMAFQDLFVIEEGRVGVIVTFLAILELVKLSMIDIVQGDECFSPIHLKVKETDESLDEIPEGALIDEQ